jgi:uncharacterized protein (DUF1330 family)
MKVENAVYPSLESMKAIVTNTSTPIAMVNLLSFRDKAAHKDGRADDIPGIEAYLRYATAMR